MTSVAKSPAPARRHPRTPKASRARAFQEKLSKATGADRLRAIVTSLIGFGQTATAPAGNDPRAQGSVSRAGLDDAFEGVTMIEPQGYTTGVRAGSVGILVQPGASGENAALICPGEADRPGYIAGTDRAVAVTTPHSTRLYLDDSGGIELGTNADLETEPTEDKGGRLRLNGAGEVEVYGAASVTLRAQAEGGATFAKCTLLPTGSIVIENDIGAKVTLAPDKTIKLEGLEVSMSLGAGVGEYLGALHTALDTWVPVPNNGAAELKTALAPLLLKTPPGGA